MSLHHNGVAFSLVILGLAPMSTVAIPGEFAAVILAQAGSISTHIRDSYWAAFGREPEPDEARYWAGQGRRSVEELVTIHRQHIKSDERTRRDMITRSYLEAFRRTPSDAEVATWNNFLRDRGYTYWEVVIHHRKYVLANPKTSPQDIDTAYKTAFGREARPAEVAHWQSQVLMNADQLVALHRDFIKGDENVRRDIVRRAYKDALKTSPSQNHMDYYEPLLRQNAYTYAELVNTLRANPYIPGECKDSRITRAFREVTGEARGRAHLPRGSGATGDCDPALYFGYSSYGDLKNKIRIKTSNRGVAYIFIIPTQAAWQGHIGWGFQRDDGRYIAGSTENPLDSSKPWKTFVVGKGDDNKAWVTRAFDTEKEMLNFRRYQLDEFGGIGRSHR